MIRNSPRKETRLGLRQGSSQIESGLQRSAGLELQSWSWLRLESVLESRLESGLIELLKDKHKNKVYFSYKRVRSRIRPIMIGPGLNTVSVTGL